MSRFFPKPSEKEEKALDGLLPEIQLLYLRGIRVYMDYATGITGIKRKISWQSLREILYVAPHSGIPKERTGTPTESKVRRIVKTLVNEGIIKQIDKQNQLVFECVLAKRDYQIQKQLDTPKRVNPTPLIKVNPTPQKTAKKSEKKDLNGHQRMLTRHPISSITRNGKIAQPDTPPLDNIYINKDTNINKYCRFLDFWKIYPVKEGKKKASEIWKRKNLNSKADFIIADVEKRKSKHERWLNGFIPHPTTYLNGERWDDEITEVKNEANKRLNGAGHKSNSVTRSVNAYIRKKQQSKEL